MGFTALARALPPTELAAAVHRLFSAFDRAVVAAGLFKVPTRILPHSTGIGTVFDQYYGAGSSGRRPVAGGWAGSVGR